MVTKKKTEEKSVLLHLSKLTLTFGLEGEVAELADIRPDVGVRSDVFLQHAWFLTADATLLADIFPSTSTTDINIVLIGLVPEKKSRNLSIKIIFIEVHVKWCISDQTSSLKAVQSC